MLAVHLMSLWSSLPPELVCTLHKRVHGMSLQAASKVKLVFRACPSS